MRLPAFYKKVLHPTLLGWGQQVPPPLLCPWAWLLSHGVPADIGFLSDKAAMLSVLIKGMQFVFHHVPDNSNLCGHCHETIKFQYRLSFYRLLKHWQQKINSEIKALDKVWMRRGTDVGHVNVTMVWVCVFLQMLHYANKLLCLLFKQSFCKWYY